MNAPVPPQNDTEQIKRDALAAEAWNDWEMDQFRTDMLAAGITDHGEFPNEFKFHGTRGQWLAFLRKLTHWR